MHFYDKSHTTKTTLNYLIIKPNSTKHAAAGVKSDAKVGVAFLASMQPVGGGSNFHLGGYNGLLLRAVKGLLKSQLAARGMVVFRVTVTKRLIGSGANCDPVSKPAYKSISISRQSFNASSSGHCLRAIFNPSPDAEIVARS